MSLSAEDIKAVHDDFYTETQNVLEDICLTKAAAVAVLGQERFDKWLANGAEDGESMKVLVCEICGESLATFDPGKLRAPVHGGMFMPLRPGFPIPWPQPASQVEWEFLKCPYCKYRIANEPDRVKTPEGMHVIKAPSPLKPSQRKKANAGKKRNA